MCDFSSGRSWTPSINVDERLRYLGEFAAISAVLIVLKLSASSGHVEHLIPSMATGMAGEDIAAKEEVEAETALALPC